MRDWSRKRSKPYPHRDCNALNTVGYKEMFDYLDGLITRDEAIREIQSNTRRYMRKQPHMV